MHSVMCGIRSLFHQKAVPASTVKVLTTKVLTTVTTFYFCANMLVEAKGAGGAAEAGLNLEHNEISDNGVLALVELLKSNERIASLNLGRNKISDTGAEVLFQWLLEVRATRNRSDVSVNLSGNNISDAFKGKILLHHSGLGLVLQ